MNVSFLPFRRMAFAVLFVPLFTLVGLSRTFAQSEIPAGALSGQFTVSEGHQVYFSQGNLQYQASTNTWRFAENQWDFLGEANNNISSTYDGWVDLFCWGTSGYNHGADCYQPWSTSEYSECYNVYGNSASNLYEQTGNADWGYNVISNGGNTENSGWRTLTQPEWNYLFYNRNTESGIRFVKAKVNGFRGVLIFPDNWDASLYDLNDVNYEYDHYDANVISLADWTSTFEPAGVVFLPESGIRYGNWWYSGRGDYWTATRYNDWSVYGLYFEEWDLAPNYPHNLNDGKSVRLARFVQTYSFNINALPSLEEGGTVSGGGAFSFGETCTVTASPNDGYAFQGWMVNGSFVSKDTTYSFAVLDDIWLEAIFVQAYDAFIDDFNDGEINLDYWNTYGYEVVEADGMIQMYNNGDNVVLESAPIMIPDNNRIVLSRRFYLHEFTDYTHCFFGNTSFLFDGNEENYINVNYYDSDDYYMHGVYLMCQVNGYNNEMYLCDVKFDTWLNETIVVDFATNSLLYFLDNVLIATMDFPTVALNYLTIRFSPNGWYSDHYHNMDWIMVNPEDTVATIAVSTDLPEGGTVAGSGSFQTWEVCTVTATPNDGYSFLGWMENGDVVSNDLEYSFVVLFNDRDLVAHYHESCTLEPENLQVQVNTPDCTEATVSWESDADLFELQYGSLNQEEHYYDDGNYLNSIGTGASFWWGVMFPAGSYDGIGVSSIRVYDHESMTGTASVYVGGDTAPGTLVGQMDVATPGLNDFVELTFDSPIPVDPSQNVWIILNCGGSYPAALSTVEGEPNGRWVSLDGSSWADLSSYGINNAFMVRAVFTNGEDGEVVLVTDIQEPNYTLTGLDDKSNYRVRVRATCGDGESFSNWVETNFTTTHYTITATVEPEEGGSISGTGTYVKGDHVVVQLFLEEGYQFVNWTENGEVISYDSYLEFDANADRELVAHIVLTCTLDPDYIEAYQDGPTAADIYWGGSNDVYDLRYRIANIEGFEYGIPGDWATIDADGDGQTWATVQPDYGFAFVGHNSNQSVSSGSYSNYIGALTPDNYLVTPQLNLGGTFTFWAAELDPYYPEEYFGVAVSTGSQTDPADFTMIQEWTMTAKGVSGPKGGPRGGNRDPSNWYYYEVDLSAYAGQTGYVAIRHFNCTDQYYLLVDDVEYFAPGEPVWTVVTDYPDTYYHLSELEEMKDYLIQVRSSCGDGETYSNWIHTLMTTTHYTVSLNSDPEGVGEMWGDGTYFKDNTCYVGTQPYIVGYHFVNWTRDGEVVSDYTDYSFTVTEDVELVAHYEPYPEVEGQMEYTSYDWQTNKGLYTQPVTWTNGDVSFAYIVSKNRDYTDRGTGIGTYHAASGEWSAVGGRVETEKSGYGSIARYGDNGMVIVSHTGSDCRVYVVTDKDQIESETLEPVSILENTYIPKWASVMTSGANHNIIHVLATAEYEVAGMAGVTNAILYFRSTDGGLTWDKENVVLPFLTPEYGIYWNPNCYGWMETTADNRLSLVVNNAWSDGMVLYSDDDGETWERKVFYQHPGPFDYQDQFFYPRSVSCQWDSNGKLHVLYEFNGTSGYPSDGDYYPTIGGVAYWNEDMEVMDKDYVNNEIKNKSWYNDSSVPMPMEYIGYLPPLTEEGDPENPYDNTGFNIYDYQAHGYYNQGVCGFPVLCRVPGSDDMVAVWAAMDENHTDVYGRHYFKIFARYSANAGQAWSPMVQLTKDASCENYEHVYLQAAVVGRTLFVAAQVDGETGSYLMGADEEMTNNFYRGFSFDLDETFVTTPMELCTVTVEANPEEGGTVQGGGEFYEGAFITLQAEANPNYEFANWTFNGEEVSTDPNCVAMVTGSGTFVAKFRGYLDSLSDDFNDGEINPDYWVAQGSDVYESEGLVHIEQNVTDDNVRLTTRTMKMPESRQIVMNRGFLVSTTGEPFSGGFGIYFDGNEDNYIRIAYWNEGYIGKYGTYFDAQINGETTEIWLCDALFDSWIDEKVEVDLTTGTLLYYQGDELIAEVTVNGLSGLEASVFNMYFWPYGWYTSHYQLMDYININADVTEATITAVASNETGGTVTGGGVYPIGETCTLTATVNNRFEFLGWQQNGLNVSDANPYSFTVRSNADYVALIEPIVYHNILVSADPEEGGTVSGGGEYAFGSYCELYAEPAEGYVFVNWTLDGNEVSSDPYYSIYVYEPGNYVAHFEVAVYHTITVSTDPVDGGTVSGEGDYLDGSTCTLHADPESGYLFSHWTYNGEVVSESSEYSFTVYEPGEYVAHFDVFNGVLVSGESQATNGYLPSYCLYNYSLTQQIYTAVEIGTGARISALSFFCTLNPKDLSRNLDIYMVHTDKTVFETSNDWIPVTEADRVFRAEVTFAANQWITCTFDQPFDYNGTDNLALVVADNSGHWESIRYFQTFYTNDYGNQAIRIYRDGTPYDPFDPQQYTGTVMNQKNEVLFWFAPESAVVEQTLNLSPGWNWWSSSLEMDATLDAALKDAIAAENTTAVIKNVGGNTMLENGTWSPDMALNNESMYMIRVDNAVTATLAGTPAKPGNHPISLASGWNWIGFPSVNAMTLDEAFASITPNEEDVVKGTSGPATYTAQYGWNGSLTGLEPGAGYMYKNNGAEMTLTYPGDTLMTIHGAVEIPEGMDASNIIITNFNEEVVPDENGEFEIGEANMLLAKNAENGKIVYLSLRSIEKQTSKGRIRGNESDLNAKETAILIALRLLPFNMMDGDDMVLEAMKAIMYSLPCVQALESAIQAAVTTYGYLKQEAIETAVNGVASFISEQLTSVATELAINSFIPEAPGGLSTPQLYPKDRKYGVELHIKESESQYLSNPDRWVINCTGYNSLFCPVGIVEGYYDRDHDFFSKNPSGRPYVLTPISVSTYVKLAEKMSLLTAGGWLGWMELYRQMRRAVNDEDYYLEMTHATLHNMIFELPRNHNALGVLTPTDDDDMRVLDILYNGADLISIALPVSLDDIFNAYLQDDEFMSYCRAQPQTLSGINNIIEAGFNKLGDVAISMGSDLPLDFVNSMYYINSVCSVLDVLLSAPTIGMHSFSFPVAAEYIGLSLPEVQTAVVDVTETTATVRGTIEGGPSEAVVERGFIYGDFSNSNNTVVAVGAGTGTFETTLGNLLTGHKYYVMAYAKFSNGEVVYSKGKTFLLYDGLVSVLTLQPSMGNNSAVVAFTGVITGFSGLVPPTIQQFGFTYGLGHELGTVIPGVGQGEIGTPFAAFAEGLEPNKTYYVRAYAVIMLQGNSIILYGDETSFFTGNQPTVITHDVNPTNVGSTTAVVEGTVVFPDDTQPTEYERGFVISTSSDPLTLTIYGENEHVTYEGSELDFSYTFTDLWSNTPYYVRAYSYSPNGVVVYGDVVSFTTLPEGGGTVSEGALPGAFSVNANGDQVHFSQGNLQYIGSAGNGDENNTGAYWKFADHQWDYLGNNGQGSDSKTVDRDLFGWGTSGYNHGANCYQPWSIIDSYSDYYAYGNSGYNLYDQTGQADWGYNAILNGGNLENSGWRTLTYEEWGYLFDTRSTSSGIRYAKAIVNNINGVILLPDNWSAEYYELNNTNTSGASYSSNVIIPDQWIVMEQYGVVFLPAAGYQDVWYGTSLEEVGALGAYWSASCVDSYDAWYVFFSDSHLQAVADYGNRPYGFSVRLVRSSSGSSCVINVSSNPTDGGTVSGAGAYQAGEQCTLTATPAPGYEFSHWTEGGVTVSTFATYGFTVTGGRSLVANFVPSGGGNTVEGALAGAFTVNANGDQVHFSQGNLQYIGSAGNGDENNTGAYWKFADHQWDYLGNNGQGSDSKTVDRDLFGWGTSGYNHGANCYQPWSISSSYSGYYAYGSDSYHLFDQSGQADWGYNAILNGGNQENNGWRTLTNEEWVYLFNTRSTSSGIRYAKAMVNNVNGVILLPDDWSAGYYTLNSINNIYASFSSNTITASQWSTLEQHGAVFLPAAGFRNGTSVYNVGSNGLYWSASYGNSNYAWVVYFIDSVLFTDSYSNRYDGNSVRLVRSAQ